MKKRIIVTAAITACLALCAAVWPQAETVEKTPAPSENDRRDHSTADTSGNRGTGVASNHRKARIGNAGS